MYDGTRAPLEGKPPKSQEQLSPPLLLCASPETQHNRNPPLNVQVTCARELPGWTARGGKLNAARTTSNPRQRIWQCQWAAGRQHQMQPLYQEARGFHRRPAVTEAFCYVQSTATICKRLAPVTLKKKKQNMHNTCNIAPEQRNTFTKHHKKVTIKIF